jgi:AcrR family transcriptional regulator
MSDPRIQKTKARLRHALVELLAADSFEHISVTDLCKVSGVTRITFYAYYTDKFALVAELYNDMFQAATAAFETLQQTNNAADDPVHACLNLLDAVLEMQEQYRDLIVRLSPEENAYLSFSYYWQVIRKTEQHSRKYVESLKPVHPLQMTTNLLCTGLWGFIRAGISECRKPAEIRAEAESLLETLLSDPSLFQSGE